MLLVLLVTLMRAACAHAGRTRAASCSGRQRAPRSVASVVHAKPSMQIQGMMPSGTVRYGRGMRHAAGTWPQRSASPTTSLSLCLSQRTDFLRVSVDEELSGVIEAKADVVQVVRGLSMSPHWGLSGGVLQALRTGTFRTNSRARMQDFGPGPVAPCALSEDVEGAAYGGGASGDGGARHSWGGGMPPPSGLAHEHLMAQAGAHSSHAGPTQPASLLASDIGRMPGARQGFVRASEIDGVGGAQSSAEQHVSSPPLGTWAGNSWAKRPDQHLD